MAWYNTGTIAATLNNTVITGTGTLFLDNVKIGDGLTVAGSTSVHEVTNVASNTQLTISPAFPGTTGSGKAYSIVPVQGYIKDLADQAKSLILSFSSVGASTSVNALANTTGAADRLPYFTSGTAMATTALTPVARTLLDDTTTAAMRTTLGLKYTAVADILGTVGQAAGVPNGAIFESGSSASGFYIRYADGTQICRKTINTNSTATYMAGTALWGSDAYGGGAYPAAFSAMPHLVASAQRTGNSTGVWATEYLPSSQTDWGAWRTLSVDNTVVVSSIHVIAIGRWF